MQSDIDQTAGFQYVEQRSNKKHGNDPIMGRTSLSSAWFSQCLNDPEMPKPPQSIICLALGSFSPDSTRLSAADTEVASCTGIHGLKQSQYQLVFLLDVILPILSSRHQQDGNRILFKI
ncbi:hypothetical protein H4Q26_015662 [Puccinia striiformis f. sp. tritici PST-130]|nr:hypothetical protein H4Q26_015662 [Puccinia striiformis f. sp. tritici PST-130]